MIKTVGFNAKFVLLMGEVSINTQKGVKTNA